VTHFSQVHGILDVGGGQGDLAQFLAQSFPRMSITVIDVNREALQAGELAAAAAKLTNIRQIAV